YCFRPFSQLRAPSRAGMGLPLAGWYYDWLSHLSEAISSLFPFMLYSRRRLLLTPPERQAMREACQFNARLMDEVRALITPGVTTGAVDKLVETYTRDHGHVPASLGY